MSNVPLVTNAKQTAATNMVAYLRNRRPDDGWEGTPPLPAPGSPAKDFIRSVPSARTRTPSANVKMHHHSMPAVPARGRIFRLGFCSVVAARQSAPDAFLEDGCIASSEPRSHSVFQPDERKAIQFDMRGDTVDGN